MRNVSVEQEVQAGRLIRGTEVTLRNWGTIRTAVWFEPVGLPTGKHLLLSPMLPPVVSRGRLRCVRVRGVRLIKDTWSCFVNSFGNDGVKTFIKEFIY